MESSFPHTHKLLLNDRPIRTTTIDGMDFVSAEDFCDYLREAASRIETLAQRQEKQISTLSTALEILCTLLGDRHPELEGELLRAAQARKRPN